MFRHDRIKKVLSLVVVCLLAEMSGCGQKACPVDAPAAPPPNRCEVSAKKTYSYNHKLLTERKGKPVRRWTVAVLRYGDTTEIAGSPYNTKELKAPAMQGQTNINVKIGDDYSDERVDRDAPWFNHDDVIFLKKELLESKAFVVVERNRIMEILREINFGKTKFVDPETSPQEGQLWAVHYIIEGSLIRNQDKTLKGNFEKGDTYKDFMYPPQYRENLFNPNSAECKNWRDKRVKRFYEQRWGECKARTACYLNVYDVYTGEVLTVVMGLGSNALEAIQDAVEELLYELANKDEGIRVAYVSDNGKVYLDVGKYGDIKVGQVYQVTRHDKTIRDRDGQIIGADETEIGEIQITQVQEDMSIAKIVHQNGKIERGDIVKKGKH
jgi:hypothetical protein